MYLKKKKYKAAEVTLLLNENSSDYEAKLKEQKARIYELIEENKKLLATINLFKEKEDSIVSALTDSREKAKEIKKKTELEYDLTVESLKKFNQSWTDYFNYLQEKYPMYKAVQKAKILKDKLSALLKDGNNKKIVDGFNAELTKEGVNNGCFNPKDKINDYVAATESNGFNLDEVLNPGALELEDLCKELGLLDEKE